LLGDPDLPAHIANRHPAADLLQDRGDLLDGKALLLHGTPSWPIGLIVPQDSLGLGPKNPELLFLHC